MLITVGTTSTLVPGVNFDQNEGDFISVMVVMVNDDSDIISVVVVMVDDEVDVMVLSSL